LSLRLVWLHPDFGGHLGYRIAVIEPGQPDHRVDPVAGPAWVALIAVALPGSTAVDVKAVFPVVALRASVMAAIENRVINSAKLSDDCLPLAMGGI
jgi:hypothetical protein